jgi:hypothetical protein
MTLTAMLDRTFFLFLMDQKGVLATILSRGDVGGGTSHL